MKSEPVLIESLMDTYGLTQKQAAFAMELVKNGGNQAKAHEAAGYQGNDNTHRVGGSGLITKNNVQLAYRSLLQEHYPEKAADFQLDKRKVVEDLELIKEEAMRNIRDGKPAGGAYNGYTRACELQGKSVGLFNTVHHQHDHTLAVVDTEALLNRLATSNPDLAQALGSHLDVVEGELIVDPHLEGNKTSAD